MTCSRVDNSGFPYDDGGFLVSHAHSSSFCLLAGSGTSRCSYVFLMGSSNASPFSANQGSLSAAAAVSRSSGLHTIEEAAQHLEPLAEWLPVLHVARSPGIGVPFSVLPGPCPLWDFSVCSVVFVPSLFNV
jgi:hypothetical protein